MLPITAAQCEHVSAQNWVKNGVPSFTVNINAGQWRTQCTMHMSSEGPPAVKFDPTASTDHWFSCDKSEGEQAR